MTKDEQVLMIRCKRSDDKTIPGLHSQIKKASIVILLVCLKYEMEKRGDKTFSCKELTTSISSHPSTLIVFMKLVEDTTKCKYIR